MICGSYPTHYLFCHSRFFFLYSVCSYLPVMSKEAQIKAVLEDYLNYESSLKECSQAREETLMKYNHLTEEHHSPDNTYNTHTAAPIISAYDEIKSLDRLIEDTRHKLNEATAKIKEYIHALKGRPLEVQFVFDSLNHRAGAHQFYLENDELKVRHLSVKVQEH